MSFLYAQHTYVQLTDLATFIKYKSYDRLQALQKLSKMYFYYVPFIHRL